MSRRLSAVLCALGLALSCPAPAFAQPSSEYERAVEARLAGDAALAERLLKRWLAEHPDDVDAKVQLGFALLALGKPDRAEEQFEAVLAVAPDYTDAQQGLAAIAQRRTDGGDARSAGFVLIEGARSNLDSGARDWREAALTLLVPIAQRDTLELRGAWYDRFGLEDIEAGALWTGRAADDLWLRLGASATPSADFRPRTAITAGADKRLGNGPSPTVIGLDAQWRRFPAQDVWSLTPGVTQYFGSEGAISLTARANLLLAENDDLRIGGSLRADWLPAPQARAFVGAAAGPDTDLGVVTQTRSLFGGGEVPLGGPFSLTGSLAREWREGPADRTDFRLGLKLGL